MGPLRNKSVSVRLEEETYLRLRRHSLRSGVPTSALVRALVHRWLQEQGDHEGEAVSVQVVADSPEDGLRERWRSLTRVILG
jgi:predicted DNA-binding protein